jgi:hypothetical protein
VAEPETASARAAAAVLHLLAGALLAHLAYGAFHNAPDLDEFQFLHEGWLVAQGQRQYVDFWDDHGPLLPLLCSIFYRLGGSGDAAALFFHRSLILAALVANAFFVRAIAQRVRPGDAFFAGLALAIYAAAPLLAHKGIEVRSDNLLALSFAAALWLWLRACAERSVRGFALAGLALGTGFLATQKAVLLGVAFVAMFAVASAAERRFAWREIAAFGIASVAVPAALALWQWSTGAFDAFFAAYVMDSVRDRGPRRLALVVIRNEAPLAAALALGAALVVLASAARRRLPVAAACLATASAVPVLLFVFALPVHVSHTLLPATIPIALTTAWALRELAIGESRGAAVRSALLVAAMVAIAGFEVAERRYAGPGLARELAAGERVAAWVPRGAILFDGGRFPVERPRALPAPSLVRHVQRQILAGRFPLDVRAELARRDVAWWRTDGRARSLERRLAEYRRANFLPVDGDVWAAGQILARSGVDLAIEIAGDYAWRTASGAPLRIDGAAVPNPVRLVDGRHRAEWDGAGRAVISVAPLDRWPETLRP